MLASLLHHNGVRDIVLSPGSRVAPLTVAMTAHPGLRCHTVVDERQAAFEALGIALISRRPVALCCTSGSAMLNYAPALAEAYYRNIPLIAITADRPAHMIDRLDSQTIRQPGTLSSVVKASYDFAGDMTDAARVSLMRSDLCGAIDMAVAAPAGPVHINLSLETPLSDVIDDKGDEIFDNVDIVRPPRTMATSYARALGSEIASPRRVAVICGIQQPDRRMIRAMSRLAALPNFAILAEITANIFTPGAITNIDDTIRAMAERPDLRPDVAIVCGGALISASLKEYLRTHSDIEIWRVGEDRQLTDTFMRLHRYIDMDAPAFFTQLASAMQPHRQPCDYGSTMISLSQNELDKTRRLCAMHDRFTQLSAMSVILDRIPPKTNLQLSNGMTIRKAGRLAPTAHRIDCNRGVSGIDGSTSTAVGAAMAYDGGLTVLLSGDMSAAYDISPLLCHDLPDRFRMVIFDNSGGGIFRKIKSTRDLDICGPHLAIGQVISPEIIAANRSLNVYEARDYATLDSGIDMLLSSDKAAVLIVHINEQQ